MVDDLRSVLTVAALELRVQRRDLSPIVVLTLMPVLLTAFLTPTYERLLDGGAAPGVTGPGQAISGLAVMFSLMLVAHVGFVFYRDHGWNTWDRYLGADLPLWALVLGKLLVPFALLAAQAAALLAAGVALFGLRVEGSWLAVSLVLVCYLLCLVALAFLGVTLCRTIMQLTTVGNVLALVFSGVGGALVPLSVLPVWLQPLAPAVPSYWAVRGLQSAFTGGDLGSVAVPALALLGFTAGFVVAAVLVFRPNERKVSWS
ncbi:ABC-2 type transport system permease protein [Actinokineospora alba]|uniref:Transport permease protein n=1 Tax=Actinokineospora alba TaxID=504798 RepID=A0A1H0HF90_9PSEU|nr:ABC transporter permease [Actinokineospora alba]TDP64912.1 ABC-2 type transport system permease protein [Actinokineospora alba]SDH49219.1 ABC-2 type transport system permease protein [Actinokineospora alba]SDO17714.1 ABC-2 type transport system permease protein [Actinokineospora alba]